MKCNSPFKGSYTIIKWYYPSNISVKSINVIYHFEWIESDNYIIFPMVAIKSGKLIDKSMLKTHTNEGRQRNLSHYRAWQAHSQRVEPERKLKRQEESSKNRSTNLVWMKGWALLGVAQVLPSDLITSPHHQSWSQNTKLFTLSTCPEYFGSPIKQWDKTKQRSLPN